MMTSGDMAELMKSLPHMSLPQPNVVSEMVLSCAQDTGRLRLGRRGEVVVFAVDGVGAPVLQEACASADQFIVYRSTFPSTSLVSWLAAVGLPPGQHPVTGPVLRTRPGLTTNYILDNQANWVVTEPDHSDLAAATPAPTMFEVLAGLGLAAEVLIGDFFGISEAWIKLLTRGALRVDPSADLNPLRMSPLKMQEAAVADLLPRLGGGGQTFCRWVYVNFDDHIHHHGYSDELLLALHRIAETAETLAAAGYTVLIHSDHGNMPNACHPDQLAAWASVDNPQYCTSPAGGAGRVRWLYPHPRLVDEVYDQISGALSDRIAVFMRDSAEWKEFTRYCAHPTLTQKAVGDVVTVSYGDAFPVPDTSYEWEHGSLHADEMIAGVAAWAGS
ncbi:MAG: hypothetical protein ABSA53_00170 [Streptosporangiaceae bacterium]|jgi:hypothetical protein